MTTPPNAPPISLPVVLAAAGRRVQRDLDDALSGVSLSMRHLGALGHLTRNAHLSVSDLARRSHITPQSMHTTIIELERAGALTRTTAGRGRRAEISVTPAGRDLLEAGVAAVSDVDARLREEIGPIGPEVMAQLVRLAFGRASAPSTP